MTHRAGPLARAEPIATLSVVMAAYEEAGTVADAIEQVLKVDLGERSLELIIVESNSQDGTREIVSSFAHLSNVHVIYQDEARGKGAAVREGFAAATGDVVLIQDADLEYSVDDYVSLLEPIERGESSFVLGSRHTRGRPMRHFADSRVTSVLMNWAHWMFAGLFDVTYNVRLRDPFTMYKVFRRECIEDVQFSSNRFDFDWELVATLIRLGHRPVEVPVSYESRDFKSGKKVRMFRDPLTWVVACAKFRVLPIRRTPVTGPAAAPAGNA
jgi:glycosyltransferase involved in cell wall biosynthesis